MKRKLIIIIISITISLLIISTGHGLWTKTLLIKGNIIVNKPDVSEKVIPVIKPEEENMDGETVTDSIYNNNAAMVDVEGISSELYENDD